MHSLSVYFSINKKNIKIAAEFPSSASELEDVRQMQKKNFPKPETCKDY